ASRAPASPASRHQSTQPGPEGASARVAPSEDLGCCRDGNTLRAHPGRRGDPAAGRRRDAGARRFLLRRDRRRGDLPQDRAPVLRAGRHRRPAAPDVPRGGPRARRGPAADVPRAVLGRPDHVLRAARAPAAADASRALPGGPRRAGPVAGAHAGRGRGRRARTDAPGDAVGLPRARGALAGEHLRGARGMTQAHEEVPSLAAVLDVLDLREAGEDTFVGDSLPQLHGRVYGGQVLAQAVVAAQRTLEGDLARRLVHSLHGYFLRPGDLDEPITFAVERLRDGGSFSARRTHALQKGVPILSMIASFQEVQDGVEHTERMPDVPGPEELPSSVELFGSLDDPTARFLHRNGAFDIRHVNGSLFVGPAPDAEPAQALWMRARAPIPGGQPAQRAVLAFA